MTDPAGTGRGPLRGRLDENFPSHGWLEQLRLWFEDAQADPAILEPSAMQLATAGTDGRPSVRTVLLKGLDERGVVFYTNLASAKARVLDENPHAAAVLVWVAHQRQVRVEGMVGRVADAEADAYFASRQRGSQIGAWASPQSAIILARDELDGAVRETERRFAGEQVPRPPFWGGYRIAPQAVEFWQGQPDRLHDRIRYRLEAQTWLVERLAP